MIFFRKGPESFFYIINRSPVTQPKHKIDAALPLHNYEQKIIVLIVHAAGSATHII